MDGLSTEILLLLALAALTAGFVDAVVGGGGLIQLPALVIALPGASPVQLLATNKLASLCGVSMSAATYYRRIRPDPQTFVPLMAAAFGGAVGGAFTATLLSKAAFTPLILAVLILVGGYVVLRPDLGSVTELRFAGRHHTAAALGVGLAVGFYDGVLGPGTGSFFVISLVGLLGYNFLEASAKARLANWATNFASFCVFAPMGVMMWRVGLVMGVANVIGGYVGARTAVSRGSSFVRVFFVVVVTAFVVRLGGELLGLWG